MELALKKGNKGLVGVNCPLKAQVNTKQAELCLNTQKANHIDWPFEHLKSKYPIRFSLITSMGTRRVSSLCL